MNEEKEEKKEVLALMFYNTGSAKNKVGHTVFWTEGDDILRKT